MIDDGLTSPSIPTQIQEDYGAVIILKLDDSHEVIKYEKFGKQFEPFDPDLPKKSYFGNALASPGDINGDGIADLAVGMFGDSRRNKYMGSVYLYTLNADLSVKTRTLLRSPNPNVFDFFGSAIASIGDVNFDGVPDLAVAAAQGDSQGLQDSGDRERET